MAEEKFIEVRPNPISKEPKFRNKVEEFIHIAKQSRL